MRVREATEGALLGLAEVPSFGSQMVATAMVSPIPSSKRNDARVWNGRLYLLKQLLLNRGDDFVDLTEPALRLVKSAFASSNAQVRAGATDCTRILYSIVGDMNLFSEHFADLKPALRDPLLISLRDEESVSGVMPAPPLDNSVARAGESTMPQPQSSRTHETPPTAGEEEEPLECPPNTCQFCLRLDSAFEVEENLDLHFWKECPMLCTCEQCGQVVEVVSLNEHLISECDGSKAFRYPAPLAVDASYNGCPFCKLELPANVDELRQHLMIDCPGNPRRG